MTAFFIWVYNNPSYSIVMGTCDMTDDSQGNFYDTSSNCVLNYGTINSSTRTTEAIENTRRVQFTGVMPSYVISVTKGGFNVAALFIIREASFLYDNQFFVYLMDEDGVGQSLTVNDKWDLTGIDIRVNHLLRF